MTESHQSSKADTSGTAKAVVSHLVTLSADKFTEEDIVKLRERELQLAFKVPETHLGGHAFHTYRLTSPDNRSVCPLIPMVHPVTTVTSCSSPRSQRVV